MKLSSLALAAGVLLGGVSTGAMAVAIDLSSGSAGFFNTPPAGAFADVYTFSLTAPTTLTGLVSSVVAGNQDVDFTSIVLTGPGGPFNFAQINVDPFEIWTISTPVLAIGAYTLTVSGSNSVGVGTYTGNLAIATVPEPETYALMLAGLGVVGFIAARRRPPV
jgi:hypothetical protein